MAIAAGENAIDQIIAALDQIGIGPCAAEFDGKRADKYSDCAEQSVSPNVLAASIASIQACSRAAIRCTAKPIARIAAAIAA